MKTIFFNLRPPNGSYGGGSFFVQNMTKFLLDNGFKVVFELINNIDIIFIIDPRRGEYFKYGFEEIKNYKKNFPNIKLIHRVNECDIKREKSIIIEPLLVKTMLEVDIVIFVSKWLQDYYLNKYNLNLKNYKYIISGCNRNNFYFQKNIDINIPKNEIENNTKNMKISKVRLVTHHWSNNYLKGFHIYNELDKLLPSLKNIEFTYIGNYNPNYKPKNIKLKPPTSGRELGDELRNHNIYITATQNEPGAMHYLEAMSCGLPILYCK